GGVPIHYWKDAFGCASQGRGFDAECLAGDGPGTVPRRGRRVGRVIVNGKATVRAGRARGPATTPQGLCRQPVPGGEGRVVEAGESFSKKNVSFVSGNRGLDSVNRVKPMQGCDVAVLGRHDTRVRRTIVNVKTRMKAGDSSLIVNHSEAPAAGLTVRTGVKA